MASQKSPKESEDTAPAAQPATPADAKSTSAQTLQAASEAAQAEQHKGLSKVSKGAFFVGIALALVLGIYVGSLVPSMFAPAATAQQAAPAQAQAPTQTRQDNQPPMPPELAAKIAAMEQNVLANPKSAENWTELGNLYFDTGQSRKAAEAYERSLALAPDSADVLTDLGIMYRELGEFDKAVASFRRASSVNPRHENAMFNEGVVLYFDLKRKDDAMKAWQRLLAINPGARAPDGQTVSDVIRNLR
ncbi:tetratricopeptide repeat protein [Desulfovibrio desulfuricans]|uniref:Tetratricopeptide repeat protein n=1 Tax=Desulfovibrio desulfuricans TaxID=876 RepID=A0A4P7UK50_DESDE|nr:tetratricopeptide repeat protein [Desulfovibrio desulfuricans]QCC86896.1 tetratricopeptide repeat protein [Desulfovibrio desulfuricans]